MRYDIICNRKGCRKVALVHVWDGSRYDGGYCILHDECIEDAIHIDEEVWRALKDHNPEEYL